MGKEALAGAALKGAAGGNGYELAAGEARPLPPTVSPEAPVDGVTTGRWFAACTEEVAVAVVLVVESGGVVVSKAAPAAPDSAMGALLDAAELLEVAPAAPAVNEDDAEGRCQAGMLGDLDGVAAENSVRGTGNLLLRLSIIVCQK